MKTLKITLLSLSAALSCQGQTLTDWNAFIFNDFNSQGGHSEKAVYTGGDFSGSYYEAAQHGTGPNGIGMYVGGSAAFSSHLRVLNGDYLYSTPGEGAGVQTNNGNEIFGPNPYPNGYSNFAALSDTIAALPSLSFNSNTPNNVKINLASAGNYVFSLDGAALSEFKTLDFQGPGAGNSTVIFNVTSKTGIIDWSWTVNGDARNVLWNFIDIDVLNVNNRSLHGSVISVDATVNMSKNIDGTLVANNLFVTNGAELHNKPFKGSLPVPEPSGVVLSFLAGFAALFRRNR